MNSEVYSVYWLHLDSHTDPKTQGYIGITKGTPERRFTSHKSRSKYNPDFNVYKAFNKYGIENIRMTVLCKTTKEHARWTETDLRSEPFTGWNMARGGVVGPEIPKEVRAEAAKKRALSMEYPKGEDHPNWKGGCTSWQLRNGCYKYKTREEWSENISKSLKGKPLKQSTKDASSVSHLKRFEELGWWVNPIARMDTWLLAGKFYVLKQALALPKSLIMEVLNITLDQASKIATKLNAGWVPLNDERWIKFYESNKDQSQESIGELKLLLSNAQC